MPSPHPKAKALHDRRKLWLYRFIDRTHDVELYHIGQEDDPTLFDRIYNQEYHQTLDHKWASNAAKHNLIWRGFEVMTASRFLRR